MFDNPFGGIQTPESAQMRSSMMPLGVGTHGLLPMGADAASSSGHGQQADDQKLCAVCSDNAICQHYGKFEIKETF